MDRDKTPEFDDSLEGMGTTPEHFIEDPAAEDHGTEEFALNNANAGYAHKRREGVLAVAARAIRGYRPGARTAATVAAVAAIGTAASMVPSGGDRTPVRSSTKEVNADPPAYYPGDRPVALERAEQKSAKSKAGNDNRETPRRTARKRTEKPKTSKGRTKQPAQAATAPRHRHTTVPRQTATPVRSSRSGVANSNRSSKDGNDQKRRQSSSDVVIDQDNVYDQEVTPNSKPDGVIEPRSKTSITGGTTTQAAPSPAANTGGAGWTCADGTSAANGCQGNTAITTGGQSFGD